MTYKLSGEAVAFVNVSDRARSMAFYTETLGLKHRSQDPFGDFLELDGAVMRMTQLPDYKAALHPVLGWNVTDIRAEVERLRERGVTFTIYEGLGQDELGIWTAPDGRAKVAFFPDPDGNVLSLAQH